MKFFLDTAHVADIREGVALGLCDGVTTNPSLLAKEKGDPRDVVREITKICDGPDQRRGRLARVRGHGPRGPRVAEGRLEHRGQDPDDDRGPEGDPDPVEPGHPDQLHAGLHADPGADGRQGRRLDGLAVRRAGSTTSRPTRA